VITISSHRRRRGPGSRRNLRSRYEATTLAPRAKQAPRRTPVRWYPTHGYQHDQPSPLRAPSLPMARATPMKAHAAGLTPPGRVRAPPREPAPGGHWGARPTKPRAVEGSQSTIARGGAISVSPQRAHSVGDEPPSAHEIGGGPQRRTGTSGPGVIVLDSGSHINARGERRAKRVRSSARFGGPRCLVAASWQQLKCAAKTWTNADRAEISAICRQNAVHVSSLGNGNDRSIDQS